MNKRAFENKLQRHWRERDQAILVAKDMLRIVEELAQRHPDMLIEHEQRISHAKQRLAPLVGATRRIER